MNRLEHPNRTTIRLNAGNASHLAHATSLLEKGGMVALPTETVYGLAGNGFSPATIRAIFNAKDRPLNNPLILHVHDAEHAQRLFDFSSQSPVILQRFQKLAQKFWPGPLTIVARKSSCVPYEATAGLESVAVRVPANHACRTILKGLDFPLVMPSANLSTRPSPTCSAHVLCTLDGRIDAVLDDGPCQVGIESTVVRIDGTRVEILRPGALDGPTLEQCLQETVAEIVSDHGAQPVCPGQAYLHYSPAVTTVRVLTPENAIGQWQSDDIFLARKSDFFALQKTQGLRPATALNLLLEDEPEEYAQKLYDALYVCEKTPHKSLNIILPTEHPSWKAVVDRLLRTSTSNE